MKQTSRSGSTALTLPLLLVLCAGSPAGGAAGVSGDEAFALPAARVDRSMTVERALALRRSVREFAPDALPLSAVSQLLWAAQGVTDPKGHRTAPSAGALYPVETYVVVGRVSELRPGVYRYDPLAHRLLLESEGDARPAVVKATHRQAWVADASVIVVLAAVYERTERKYGERAARYVHMEVGHAAQNVYLQAGALGLGTTMVGAFDDEKLARALGLPAQHCPLGLLPIGKPR